MTSIRVQLRTKQLTVRSGSFGATLTGSTITIQDSWNLGFDFLEIYRAFGIPPPSFPAFDPNSAGE